MEKQNLTQQKHTFTNQNKCTTTQNKHKKLKPGLVASYEMDRTYSYFGDSEICHLLTYLDTHLHTARTHTGPPMVYTGHSWL